MLEYLTSADRGNNMVLSGLAAFVSQSISWSECLDDVVQGDLTNNLYQPSGYAHQMQVAMATW